MAWADVPGSFRLTRTCVSCYGDTMDHLTIESIVSPDPLVLEATDGNVLEMTWTADDGEERTIRFTKLRVKCITPPVFGMPAAAEVKP